MAVVGAGIVGLSAALAFARALPGAEVTLVDLPVDPAALADRMPGALPTIHRFHAAIGIDEPDLVRRGIALHHLGTRFENWSADGAPWFHAYGDHGVPAGPAAFHILWARARRRGKARPFDRYAAGAALAEAGKFVHPSADPNSPLASFLYGLRFDPDLYRERLRSAADALPIRWAKGMVAAVGRRADGGVAALVLDGGQRIEADLFIDCAGPSAPVRSKLDERFESWADALPCDRLLIGRQADVGPPLPADVVTALADGWRRLSGFPGGAIRVEAITGEREGGVALRPGCRPEPWLSNVLAVGDAAVAVDPLENANLHLAHSAILRALELLPGRDCHPLELREYNRRTEQETRGVRDFLALHYLRSGRRDGRFWQGLAQRPVPSSLAHMLEQFAARGRLPFREEESFDRHSWLAVLLGMGLLPDREDPIAGAVGDEEAEAAMERHARTLATLPARLPTYPDYLARMVRAPATSARPGT
ncbi:MAG TPA: tryptophan 7-halogenase [Allosphingosinicella sp.]